MERQHASSGTEWESTVGYSRAVRVGPHVDVSGTTATDEHGDIVGLDDPAAQTRQALENVAQALDAVDASLADVTRTRMYVTDIDDWEAIGRVHGEVFEGIDPATSMVEVSQLIDPAMCVEIEAEAIVADALS